MNELPTGESSRRALLYLEARLPPLLSFLSPESYRWVGTRERTLISRGRGDKPTLLPHTVQEGGGFLNQNLIVKKGYVLL